VLWDEAWGENPFARKEPPDPLLLIPDWAGPEPWREVEASLLEDALVMEDGETRRQTSGQARGEKPRAGRQMSESTGARDARVWEIKRTRHLAFWISCRAGY